MAEIAVWIQMKNTNRIRKISATSLTWTWGRLVQMTCMYVTGTAGTNVTVATFTQRIESAPAPGTAVVESAEVSTPKAITVGAESILYTAQDATPATFYFQLSPYIRASGSTPVVPGELKKILDCTITDYIRFNGTELSSSGIVFMIDEIAGMFTTEPSAAEL